MGRLAAPSSDSDSGKPAAINNRRHQLPPNRLAAVPKALAATNAATGDTERCSATNSSHAHVHAINAGRGQGMRSVMETGALAGVHAKRQAACSAGLACKEERNRAQRGHVGVRQKRHRSPGNLRGRQGSAAALNKPCEPAGSVERSAV
ncbi:hypothetical protein D3C71_1462530 [compost metagenome]